MTIEELKARDYEDIPLEVCGGVYETVKKHDYSSYWTDSHDVNLREWCALGGAQFKDSGKVHIIICVEDMDDDVLDQRAQRIRKNGQIAFYAGNLLRLRRYFDSHFDKWSTFEIPVGDGLFVARKIAL